MRILFTFIGGVGHFHPLVPVARAATEAGHEVAVACSGGLVSQVEALGFTALATSEPRTLAREPLRDMTPLAAVDLRAAEEEFAENFATKGARRHAAVVQEHLRGWGPDVVVRDEADLGTAIAAEVLGVPRATVLVLAAGMLERPELVSPPLAALRAEHGLPADPELTMLTRGLTLSPFPPSFRSPASPLRLQQEPFCFRYGERVPLATEPPGRRVYVTLGTVFNSASGDLWERLLAGLAGVEADIVVTIGRDLDPADLGAQPPHISIERFVPQATILGHTDLVVSHGGSGSLLATLAHGLPSVLLPLGADQPHNAIRAEELGLAVSRDAATVTAHAVRQTVTAALQDDDMRRRARDVAREMAELPSVVAAVPLLERLATSS
jgi:UDP:flavonoid glycosyltransferase YjiC (YdhE family)